MIPKIISAVFAAALSIFAHTAVAQVFLPDLNYEEDALEPYISAETISYHYGKHHQGYVDNMNAFIEEDPSLAGLSLRKLVKTTEGTIFNNAAQIWNHNLYWKSLSPTGGGEPSGSLLAAIEESYGTYEDFQTEFTSVASGHFGSGWAWLIVYDDNTIDVVDSHDAHNPFEMGIGSPILVCDVWEHAYYIDYRNGRSDYIESWWALVNWEYAEKKYEKKVRKSENKDRQ